MASFDKSILPPEYLLNEAKLFTKTNPRTSVAPNFLYRSFDEMISVMLIKLGLSP